MDTVFPSLLSLLFLARISGFAVAFLVLFWALSFKSSFLTLPSLPQQDLNYAVLHPVLMVIGFILLSGEAILVHRWLPGSRGLKKSVHLCLQGVALASGIFGIWTKFKGEDGIVANFYSLHSWMGLICISLFGAQFVYIAVANRIHELLAPRRNANSEDKDLAMACICWPIHLCIGSSNSRNWITREVNILANTEKCIQAQH
ncbi:unnamed protein product [Trifolium pratense]|uniref:Uncharacterized protein n=1 Tax=Trifolium pratense TaxID=57577 RepID=A0ACB0JWF8_TRIPR|nr:unnamed protein product [Trifolium pratense]